MAAGGHIEKPKTQKKLITLSFVHQKWRLMCIFRVWNIVKDQRNGFQDKDKAISRIQDGRQPPT